MQEIRCDEIIVDGISARNVVLCNSQKANCLTLSMLENLLEIETTFRDSLLILSASGNSFCAGLDLKEVAAMGTPADHLERLIPLYAALASHPAPTLSLVTGSARGGGVGLACAVTIVIASPGATFALPSDPAYHVSAEIPLEVVVDRRSVGIDCARELLRTTASAVQCLNAQLIDAMAPANDFEAILHSGTEFLKNRNLLGRTDLNNPLSARTIGRLQELRRQSTSIDALEELRRVLPARPSK